jgi:hypothetical protein
VRPSSAEARLSLSVVSVRPPRDVVVTPGRAFGISGLIPSVLLCPLVGVVEPGVGEPVRQAAFSLSDVVDEGTEVGAAPTTGGYGVGSAEGDPLAAVALEGDVGRMPPVGLAERDFAGFVVRSDALEDLHHGRLYPFLPPFLRQGVAGRGQVGRVGGCPESRREAGSRPTIG